MDLRQMEYLVVVAEEGSFSAAARRLGVAQPSISQQIRKLEEDLGQPLLDRLSRGVVPTPAGSGLIDQARHILEMVEDARRRVSDASEQASGPLTVSAIPTIAPFVLPRLVEAFERLWPQVELTVVEDTTPQLVERLRRGEIDLAITSRIEGHESLHLELVTCEPLDLMLPAGHPLARRRSVSWSDLAGERFVGLHEMHCLRGQTSHLCLREGLEPPIVMQGANLFTLAAMVAAGMGVSIVPRMLSRASLPKGLVFRRLAGAPARRDLVLVWSLLRYRSLAARRFAQMAAEVLKQAGGEGRWAALHES